MTTVGGTAVFINGNGQLGTVVSSARYKRDIESMGDRTDTLMRLRPVTFHYKAGDEVQYGLIAEEVAEVDPSLVLFGRGGTPQTVHYHFLAPLLLNEVQKQRAEIEELRGLVEDLRNAVAVLQSQRARPE